jgi:hypothetical protein
LLQTLLLRQVPRCLARLLVPVVWVARHLVNHHFPLGFSGGSHSSSSGGRGRGSSLGLATKESPKESPKDATGGSLRRVVDPAVIDVVALNLNKALEEIPGVAGGLGPRKGSIQQLDALFST